MYKKFKGDITVKETTTFFEYLYKTYSYKELVEHLNKKEIICLKDVKQKVSFKRLEAMSIENVFTIKLFKSYDFDKYIVLEGAKYLVALFREYFLDKDYKYDFKEVLNSSENIKKIEEISNFNIQNREFKNFDKEIQITIIYSNKESEFPREFYKRIKTIYSVPIRSFLKK